MGRKEIHYRVWGFNYFISKGLTLIKPDQFRLIKETYILKSVFCQIKGLQNRPMQVLYLQN